MYSDIGNVSSEETLIEKEIDIMQNLRKYSHLNDGEFIFGDTPDIKNCYRKLYKRALSDIVTYYTPLYCDFPKFNMDKEYCIHIDSEGYFTVVSREVGLDLLENLYTYANY